MTVAQTGSGSREQHFPFCQALGEPRRAVVRGLGPGTDAVPAFEYKVPFGIMDTAQSWPFVVFKQIMIPTFQTI